jgi:hypothetical protein
MFPQIKWYIIKQMLKKKFVYVSGKDIIEPKISNVITPENGQEMINQNGIIITDACYESDPCEHPVKIDDDDWIFLDASSIVNLLTERHIPIPTHFTYASDTSDADAGLDLFG